MMPTRYTWMMGMVLALVMALTAPALAQGPPGPPGDQPPEDWEELMGKISLLRNYKLIEALDMDEKTATKLAVYMKDHDKTRMELQERKRKLGKEVRDFMEADSDDDTQAAALLTQAAELADAERQFDVDLLAGLGGILAPSQQLKFMMVNREFDREVQDVLHEHRRGHKGGPRGGPPPRRED